MKKARGRRAAGTSIFSPTLSLFLFAMILANLGGMMFFSFFAIYLRSFGLPIETIGVFFTLSAIFPLIFQIAGGWISDRLGRLKSIAIGSAAGAVSWIGTLVAPATSAPIVWFLAANALGSVTGALVAPSFDAFVAEQSDEKNRARVFAVVQSVFLVVGIAGPPLGGLVAEKLSYGALAWIAAVLYWSATIIRIAMARKVAASERAAAAAKSEAAVTVAAGGGDSTGAAGGGAEPARAEGFRKSLKAIVGLVLAGGLFAWLLVVDGALDFSGRLTGEILPLFLKEAGGLPESRIGVLQSLSALVMALCLVGFGAYADKRGERQPIALGCALMAAGSCLLWLGQGFVAYAAAFALWGVAGAAFQPAMQSLASKAVPEHLRGLAFGFLGTSLGVFSFFAPALGGYLWKRFFPAFPFLVAGFLTLAALPLVLGKLIAPAAPAAPAANDTATEASAAGATPAAEARAEAAAESARR
ncbi:MAG: MFS transporter [Spirochaetaceae bacterium]|nr:MFS transporter [Spirochaetaceae bacterium]